MSKIKILVTGANGQVGKSLKEWTPVFDQFEFYFFSRKDLDITNKAQVITKLEAIAPHYCINTAAYTAVDKAEEESVKAFKINRDAISFLCDGLSKVGGKLIHYSTDYVYGGAIKSPIKESQSPLTEGVYAESKYAGDQLALLHDVESLILRTSWVYSPFGHNFVKTMLRLGQSRTQLNVVNDQVGSPTYASDLAYTSLEMIRKIENGNVDIGFFNDIYHCSNEGQCTWAQFAKSIFKHSKMSVEVTGISTSEYPTLAKRPAYSVLDKSKLKERFQLTMPHWEESLLKCLQKLNK